MMRYAAYHELGDEPNIVVDGYGTDSTVMTLSHWPGSATPAELRDDLSTQIAFRYLDSPSHQVTAEAVSNNHFDEDGLCGIYAILHPNEAQARREQLIDIAYAGDFGTFRERNSARIAFALMAYSEAATSPLDAAVFSKPYPVQTEVLYTETLALLPELMEHPGRFEGLWAPDDAALERSEVALEEGIVTIEERPEIDLAIVRGACHPSAVHNRTRRMRILEINGGRYSVRYRYETWVVYVSETLPPRVDLGPLAERLNQVDAAGWSFDGNDDLQPALSAKSESALDPEAFIERVTAFLA